MEIGGSFHTSTRTSNATACNASRTPVYKMPYINLNIDLKQKANVSRPHIERNI
jgi:hypothetical protein